MAQGESGGVVAGRERRGDKDEPVAEIRAPNDSGKGSKLHFDLEKRGLERNGLATRQCENKVRHEQKRTEERVNVREG